MCFSLLSDYTPIILVSGGVAAVAWLFAILLKSAPIVGSPMSKILKGISIFGFFVGLLLLFTGAAIWSAGVWDIATKCLLLITGLSLFLKPLRQLPWATLFGLIIGLVSVFLAYSYFPIPEIVFNISSTWLYLAIFFISALVSYFLFKFLEDLGRILASKPVATILGIICISHGILLLFNQNLFSILGI